MHTGLWLAASMHRKARQIVQGRRETLDRIARSLDPSRQCIWFHAASLGEFEQGRPLIEAIRQRYPQEQILLSFFSPSGYTVRCTYDQVDAVVYLPADTIGSVETFLEVVQPSLAIFIKYDFWPTMLHALRDRKVPTYLVSAIFRPDQLFFKPYGGWYLRLLDLFAKLFVQDEASRLLLERYGVQHTEVVGDTRFDRVHQIAEQIRYIPEAEALRTPSSRVVVAGSSWPPDEAILLDYFERTPSLRLILAPHEIDEEHLAAIEARLTRPSVRYSQLLELSYEDYPVYDCLLIDRFGLLSSLYRYADVAYVGGGFGRGIHNTIEAAVYGIPVLFGPKMDKFREARDLVQCRGGQVVHDAAELATTLDHLLGDEEACRTAGQASAAYITTQLGATDRVLSALGL